MKVGDLVRWIHPVFQATGVVIRIWDDDAATIFWSDGAVGRHAITHHNLELISESR